MKQKIWKPFFLYLVLIAFTQYGCNGQATKAASPKGYDLTNPQTIKLPKEVDQISGIIYEAKDNAVFAIDDDHGSLYKIPLTDEPAIQQWEFGAADDYEDVTILNDSIYVLSSKGRLMIFPAAFPINKKSSADLGLTGKNEFETLYAEPAAKQLIMLCKNCDDDKKSGLSAYAFDAAAHRFQPEPVYTLKHKELEKVSGEKVGRFKPSAANINPLTGEVYIISSINKLLVVADKNLNVKEAYNLDPKLFKQPEGLCFTPSGDLLISNESAGKGKATILIFRHRK